MYHKNFKYLPWVESIEVARPTIGDFYTQKSSFSAVFFCGFLSNRPWTNGARVATQYPPQTQLMQEDPTDILNKPRRGTISGVQNVTLYYKIDTEIQLFRWVYQWSLGQGLYNTLDPLVLYLIEHKISTPEKPALYTESFRTY